VNEVIDVTPAALEVVKDALALERRGADLALWLEVNGIADGSYTYDLWFGPKSAMSPGDVEQIEGDICLVVPSQSIERLRGAVLDLSERSGEIGLVILNPNKPTPSVPREPRGEATGPVAQHVLEVLERDVNPAIAGHGGHVELIGIEGHVAYVEMSGGCQGCGLARATLSQNIAVAVTDAVAEIREVVDVTDHLLGTSPYFEPGLV